MSGQHEVEIKFRVDDLGAIERRLRDAGFRQQTPRTHEMNTLYDHLGSLRRKGSLLRLRKYGESWVLTHKGKGQDGRHKTRVETETNVADGNKMASILDSLGYSPSFQYEKFRSEWTDGQGHVVLDETPIGNFGEIEGQPDWIDKVAARLEIPEDKYITKSYSELFREWRDATRSRAKHMTFAEIEAAARK